MLTKTSMDLLSVGHEGEVSTVLVLFLHICSVEGLRSGPASRYLFIARLAHSLGVVINCHTRSNMPIWDFESDEPFHGTA